MRNSDWSRRNLLRSDWSGPRVALITTVHGALNSLKISRFASVDSLSCRQYLLLKKCYISGNENTSDSCNQMIFKRNLYTVFYCTFSDG